MPSLLYAVAPIPATMPPLTVVNLDATTAAQLVPTLVQSAGRLPAQVLVDCGTLQALRTIGVSHVVSELLLLRQGGAQVWLCNVGPVLHQCLRVLQLDRLFFLAE